MMALEKKMLSTAERCRATSSIPSVLLRRPLRATPFHGTLRMRQRVDKLW